MAKPKSMKLRTIVTLRALLKYSDANHRMNSIKLNEHLRSYGLDCTGRVLRDTVHILREIGIDVRHKGEWDNQGIWIENRPLPDHELNRLIFAVSTNPHLSKDQATDILQSLKPFVTVYQEPQLQGLVETISSFAVKNDLYDIYAVINEAIATKRRVRYSTKYVKYIDEKRVLEEKEQWTTLFTPKCIYQAENALYMIGYNNTDRRCDAVNLKDIASIKMAFKHKDPKAAIVKEWIADIDPTELTPGEKKEILYEGPVTFYCRGQYVSFLHQMFGEPEEIEKDARCRTTYTVKHARITSETLFKLSQIPNRDVRIIVPQSLTEAIKNYYGRLAVELLNPVIPANRPKIK